MTISIKTSIKFIIVAALCVCFSICSNRYIGFNKKWPGTYFSTYPNDITPANDTYVNQIELNKAWDISTGNDSVLIGIIDSGISNVPYDLSTVLNTSLSKDCLNLSRSPFEDSVGHGTSVGGIVGAKGDNGTSKSGIMWNSSVVSLRADENAEPHLESPEAVAFAIAYAESQNIPILNFSGGFGSLGGVQLNFIQYCTLYAAVLNYSGLLVCAAGNESTEIGSNGSTLYPQMFDLDNILVVGSVDSNNYKKSYSNYSSTYVDVFAPTDIATVYNGSSAGTRTFDYTSCSSPVVAGIAGLLKSYNPNLTTSQLKSAILTNVDYAGDVYDYCSSHGIVNPYKALQSLIPHYSIGQQFSSFASLQPGYHHFYKIDALVGDYSFYNTSSLNLTATLYSDIQGASLVSGSCNGNGLLFSYYFPMPTTYYLKIENNSAISGSYSIDSAPTQHIHSYSSSYSWENSRKHKAFCSCGTNQLRGHVVNSGGNICILCGGFADMGIVGPLNLGVFLQVLNDSYILPNGVIVLGDRDYSLYILGRLSIDDIYNCGGMVL